MTWAKLDDKMHSHAKVVAAGNEAIGLWVRLLAWCSEHATDGAFPTCVARMFGDESGELCARLLDVGMIDETPDGFELHDFLAYNPSAKHVATVRKKRAISGAKGGSKRQANAKQIARPLPAACDDISQANFNPDPDPDPDPDPGSECERAGARARTHARHGDSVDESLLSPDSKAILAELRRHASLRDAATVAMADHLSNLVMTGGKSLDLVLLGVREAAEKWGAKEAASHPGTAQEIAGSLPAFCRNARAPREDPAPSLPVACRPTTVNTAPTAPPWSERQANRQKAVAS